MGFPKAKYRRYYKILHMIQINTINKKILNRITVDIDHYKAVPRALLKAITLFGKENVKLYMSASGTGFRLEIRGKFTPLENIYYRCILDDDPFRIRFALARYLSTDNPDLLDVSFYYKISIGRYSGKIKEIPIDELVDDSILERYKQNPNDPSIQEEILKKLTKYTTELYLWVVVIPANEKYIKILSEHERKFKLLRDPYHDDRIIFYQVSSDNVVERLSKLGIPVLHFKRKVIKSKSIYYDESEL